MEELRLKTNGCCSCTCTLEDLEIRATRFDLESRLTNFLENMPKINKHWLHYKM
jgi:hypothetical protein